MSALPLCMWGAFPGLKPVHYKPFVVTPPPPAKTKGIAPPVRVFPGAKFNHLTCVRPDGRTERDERGVSHPYWIFDCDCGAKGLRKLSRLVRDGDIKTCSQKCPLQTSRHTYEFRGQSKTIAQWAVITKIPARVIYERMRLGWTVERALTKPTAWKPRKRRS